MRKLNIRKPNIKKPNSRKSDAKKTNMKKPDFGNVKKILLKNRALSERKQSIRNTLMLAFAIPVVLMIILGVVSYNIASSAVQTKYKESALSTVDAVGNYLGLICDNVYSKALELVTDSDVLDYYNSHYDKNSPEAIALLKSAKTTMQNIAITNSTIYNCSVIADQGMSLSTISGNPSLLSYEEFLESAEGMHLQQDGLSKNVWIGQHSYFDDKMGTDSGSYAMSLLQSFSRKNCVLLMDIDMSVFDSVAQDMDFGDGCIKALITRDGYEVSRIQGQDEIPTDLYFVGQKFYENTRDAEEPGAMDVSIKGKRYVYIYAPIAKTGASICALIPRSNLLEGIGRIGYITAIIVIFSGIIAIFIGLVISTGIGNTVKSMSAGLSKLEQGDFTNEFHTERRDEFRSLTKSLNAMLTSLRKLMQDMKGFSARVDDMSGNVYEKTESINISMEDISTAMNEVAQGVQSQAQETESSHEKMRSLSDNINAVTDKANYMVQTADNTIATVEQGKNIVSLINEKSAQTVDITKVLVEDINKVQKQSEQIKGIVEIINNIAEQTNLLSLNASIEAARAGDAGRGFSVVAEEIRKLADQSNQSGNQIRGIVESIGKTSSTTSVSVKEAETMVLEQAQALSETVEVFTAIHQSVGGLVEDIHAIMERLEAIMNEKDMVEMSIQNISAASEEVSAATEEVSATLGEQVNVMNSLAREVEALRNDVDTLNDSMDKFKI